MKMLDRFIRAIGAAPNAVSIPKARPVNKAELYGRVDEARGVARELAGASLGFVEGARALGDRLETRGRVLTQAVAAMRPTDRSEPLVQQALQFAVDGERALCEVERVFHHIDRSTRQIAELLLAVDDAAVQGGPSAHEVRGLLTDTVEHLRQGTLQVERAGAAIRGVATALSGRAR